MGVQPILVLNKLLLVTIDGWVVVNKAVKSCRAPHFFPVVSNFNGPFTWVKGKIESRKGPRDPKKIRPVL